jgi:hypothetical protein
MMQNADGLANVTIFLTNNLTFQLTFDASFISVFFLARTLKCMITTKRTWHTEKYYFFAHLKQQKKCEQISL